MSNDEVEVEEMEEHAEYLDDIEDGAGCAEIWEYISEQRKKGSSED